MEGITVVQIRNIFNNFLKNGMSIEEYKKWVEDNIKFKQYIPISEKLVIVEKVNFYSSMEEAQDVTPSVYAYRLEKSRFFNSVIPYTNIIIQDIDKTDEVYDMLNIMNIEYLVKKKTADYGVLFDMITNAINHANTSYIYNAMKQFDSQVQNEQIDKLQSVLSDKETIDKVHKILEFNDPSIKKYRSEMQSIMSKAKLDKEEVKEIEKKKRGRKPKQKTNEATPE